MLDAGIHTEKYTCSELGHMEDFLGWIHDRGKFKVDQVCLLHQCLPAFESLELFYPGQMFCG